MSEFDAVKHQLEIDAARQQGFVGGFLVFAAFVGKFYGASLPDKYLTVAADNEYRKWVKELEASDSAT